MNPERRPALPLQTLLSGLAPDVPTTPANGALDPLISAIQYDSRRVGSGDLYVAIRGGRSDGHDHIPAAIAAGAVAVVCDQDWFTRLTAPNPAVAWLPVANPRAALAQLAASFYGHPGRQMKLIGITGTNGKTTTAHLVSRLFEAQGIACGWIGTLGAGYGETVLPGQYTTPFPPELQALLAQMRDAGVRAVVMECSSHALDQHRLDALEFDSAVFTNLTQDHLDYHLTLEAYGEAKSLLFSRLLKPAGTAVINRDDPNWKRYRNASTSQVLTYSLGNEADLQALDLVFDAEGASFSLRWQGQDYPIKLRLTGKYNAANALAALGVAFGLGLDPVASIRAIETITGVPGRLERVSPDGHPFAVYVDYAHTPDSLENALKAVRQFSAQQVLVVFGCGGDRDRGKRPLMAAAAESLADKVFVTSDNPRSEDPDAIIQEILTGLKLPQAAVVEPDRRAAIAAALTAAGPGDVVLIAGKGHENYQIIGQRTLHFDDREEAQLHLGQTAIQDGTRSVQA